MWQKKRKRRGGEKAKINSQYRCVVVFLLKTENENLFSAHARTVTGGSGTNRFTLLLLLSFNVLGHAGRDTPSIDSVWRMSGSLNSKKSSLDRFRPGVISVMPLKMAKFLVWIILF